MTLQDKKRMCGGVFNPQPSTLNLAEVGADDALGAGEREAADVAEHLAPGFGGGISKLVSGNASVPGNKLHRNAARTGDGQVTQLRPHVELELLRCGSSTTAQLADRRLTNDYKSYSICTSLMLKKKKKKKKNQHIQNYG